MNKCKIGDCEKEAHKDLTYEVQSKDGRWNEIILCPDCYRDLTGECPDCITNSQFDEVPGEGRCHNCLVDDAESLKDSIDGK